MKAIIDADNLVLGRLASVIAKRLLNGEQITVVNAEKAIIQGSRKEILEDYLGKNRRGSQKAGPYYPRRPDRIFKRTVRGMLPYQKPRGREALKRLRVYIGIPDALKEKEMETLPDLAKVPKKAIRLEEVSNSFHSKY
jgi:large subunit ribosomal protein L13